MKKKSGNQKCSWVHERFDTQGREFSKCSVCGRVKRTNLPDAQNCSGSQGSHKLMLKRILGGEEVDKEINFSNH